MEGYLVDTCIFVDHFRGRKDATSFLSSNRRMIVVSLIVVGELVQEAKDKRELNKIIRFLDKFEKVGLDANVSRRGIDLLVRFYLSNGIKLLDALIVATALEKQIILVTDNVKHFEFVKGLKVVKPGEIG